MLLKELKNKKILILGFGEEGRDTFLAIRRLFPHAKLGVADQQERTIFSSRLPRFWKEVFKKDKRVVWYLGKNYLAGLNDYEIVIKTPGISLRWLKPWLNKRQIIISQTDLFLQNCPGTVIGVTGTKGKGTTTSLICQILKRGGRKVRQIGNIGTPVLNILLRAKEKDIFVYELSAQQLDGLKVSPSVAVFLNLFPAHLDFFGSFKRYKKAKENIALYQKEGDYFIYNQADKNLRELAKKTKAKKITLALNHPLLTSNKLKKIKLKGKYNQINIAAAIRVGELFKIPQKKIEEAIVSFKPLPHRLEFVGEYQGIEFYDDSIATVPEATMAGIEALGSRLKTLITGAQKIKGITFSELAKRIIKSRIETLILMPDTGKEIWREVMKQGERIKRKVKIKPVFVSSMEEAVRAAYEFTPASAICLLSPTAPSFNLFRDYKERGELFKKFVRKYGGGKMKKEK